MKLSDFGKKHSGGTKTKSAKELEAGRRLEQVITRLQVSLALGWDSNERGISKREKATKWVCLDVSAQTQASRALLGFAECVAVQFPLIQRDQVWRQKLQVLLVEITSALESLLLSSSLSVRNKSAMAAEVLALSIGNLWGQVSPIDLLPPLSTLLNDKDEATARSAGKALEYMLHKMRIWDRPSNFTRGSPPKHAMNDRWQNLSKVDPLSKIFDQLGPSRDSGGLSGGNLGSVFLGVLEGLLLHWSVAKVRVEESLEWWELIAGLCKHEEDDIAKGAFRCAAVMVGDSRTSSHLADRVSDLWRSVSVKLRVEKKVDLKDAALKLLSLLLTSSAFETVLEKGEDWASISSCCVKSLLASPESLGMSDFITHKDLILQYDSLRQNAIGAICALLRWPGKHHEVFLQAGLLDSLIVILQGSKRGEGEGGDVKEGRQNPRLRLLAWEALAWFGTHCNLKFERSSSKNLSNSNNGCAFDVSRVQNICFLLGGTFIHLFQRRSSTVDFAEAQGQVKTQGSSTHRGSSYLLPPNFQASPQEVLEICKATYAFISSRNEKLSRCQRESLDMAVKVYGKGWVPSLVRQLSAYTRNSNAKGAPTDNFFHLGLLRAIAVLLNVPRCLTDLIHADLGELLFKIVKNRFLAFKAMESNTYPEDLKDSLKNEVPEVASAGFDLSFCDEDGDDKYFGRPVEDWEGNDAVLFSSLLTLAELFHNQEIENTKLKEVQGTERSTSAGNHNQNERERERGSGSSTVRRLLSSSQDDETKTLKDVELLLLDVSGEGFSSGVRWKSVESLSFLGRFGFSSVLGKCMLSVFNTPSLADTIFQFNTGEKIYVHAAVLASRCPNLLSAFGPKGSRISVTDAQQSTEPKTSKDRVSHGAQQAASKGSDGGPLVAHVSSRLSYAIFRSFLEFVYTGMTVVPAGGVAEMAMLAKKFEFKHLTELLLHQRCKWGEKASPCDLSRALLSVGWPFRDALLYTDQGRSSESLEKKGWAREVSDCNLIGPHIHVHRVILESRCEYLAALFRSGMRDSVSGLLFVPEVHIQAVTGLVRFLYSGKLSFESIDQPCCSKTFGNVEERDEFTDKIDQKLEVAEEESTVATLLTESTDVTLLTPVVELAHLAEAWMMEDLQKYCWGFVFKRLTFENALHVLKEGEKWRQWGIVERGVECVASGYLELRDGGKLECLSDELQEAIRVAHVKLLTL